jgi:signal transduction histidine kinase
MRERLLVVDDERNVVTFCTRTLQRCGYEVQSALSGEEALELLQRESFDLLATDIKMPGMSGLELMRQAVALRADLAVIVITGMGTFDVAVDTLRAGAHDFLAKPFGADELTRAVEYALEQARLARERARLRLIEPLLELSQQTLANPDLETLALAILNIAVAQTRGLGAALLLEQPKQTFSLGLTQAAWLGLGGAAARHAADGGPQVLAAQELALQPNCLPQDTLGTLIRAPLDARSGHIGTLLIALDKSQSLTERSELDVVSLLAGQAAALLDNALLVQELEDWNRNLEQRVSQRTAELQAAQDRLLRAEKLATVGQLGSSIAHELRNPLGVISNSVYYLKMRLGDDLDERVAKHLDIITREVQASNSIITDLMNFVRVHQIEQEPTAPEALVLGVLERAQIPAQVRVTVHVPENLPRVCLDRDKMHHALLNLVDNAVQAMPHGGELTIRGYVEHDALCLAIKDSGEGIPRENMERIFEPLFTTKARGIGLGLAIVRMMVEAHGGQVRVTSELGQGTTFTLLMPRKMPQAAAEELCA